VSNELAAALGQLAALYPFVSGLYETESRSRTGHMINSESIFHAYHRAVTEGTREREPEKWFNIAAAYGVQTFFEGLASNDTALLEQSTRALKEAVSLRAPQAKLKMIEIYFGQSLLALADRRGSVDLFQQAASTFRSALEKVPSGEPEFRTFVLSSLGITHQMLGVRQNVTDSLKEAVASFQLALREPSDIRQWRALINIHLGDTLIELGERERARSRVVDAMIAYREALSVQLDHEARSHLWERLASAKRLLETEESRDR
jgi:tetratricopeptide (TPR) repeat protein